MTSKRIEEVYETAIAELSAPSADALSKADGEGYPDRDEVVSWTERVKSVLQHQRDRGRLRAEVPALGERLLRLLMRVGVPEGFEPEAVVGSFVRKVPEVRRRVAEDVEAAFEGDPAAKSFAEIVVSYPSIEAIAIHRLAHELVNGSIVRHAVAWAPQPDGGYEALDLGVPESFDVSSASGVNVVGEVNRRLLPICKAASSRSGGPLADPWRSSDPMLAAPLADQVFKPAMAAGGALQPYLGTHGSGREPRHRPDGGAARAARVRCVHWRMLASGQSESWSPTCPTTPLPLLPGPCDPTAPHKRDLRPASGPGRVLPSPPAIG